jgi:hypothetical protein
LVQGYRVIAICTSAPQPRIGIGGSHWINSKPVRWSTKAVQVSFTVPGQVLRRATMCNLATEQNGTFGVFPGSEMTAARAGT